MYRLVNDDGSVEEIIYPNAKDAIKAAHMSGYDVYLHADDCRVENPGPRCSCKPLLIRKYP